MTYYHYTTDIHLPSILADGVLRTTESNVSILTPHAGPDVVWLLDTDDLTVSHGLPHIKQMVRIVVDVPAIKWTDWEWTHKMGAIWRMSFTEAGGGIDASKHWYVYPAAIPRKRWTAIEYLVPNKDGELTWVQA